MALPLPKVVPDVLPGGGIVTAMGGINALNNAMHEAEFNRIKAQLAPYSLGAEAASKLAYANLMGPQFLAKLMGNENLLANLSEEQKRAGLGMAYRAGSGQGTGNAFLNMPGMQGGSGFGGIFAPQKRFSFTNWLQDKFRNKIDEQQAPVNALNNYPQPQGMPVQRQPESTPVPEEETSPVVDEEEIKNIYNEWLRSPEGEAEMAKGDEARIPDEKTILAWDNARKASAAAHKEENTFAENTGEFKRIIKEGEEQGKIRANQRKELDDQVKQALQVAGPLKHLGAIIKNPTFQNARKLPGFQKLQLDAKAQIGSKAEQDVIGDFQATALQVVADTVMGFGGRILDKEIGLSNDMKLSPKDTIGVMLGKYPSIVAFKEMTKQRSSIASKLMNQNKSLTLTEALEKADKQVDGEKIRARVKKELNAKPAELPITEDDINTTVRETGMTREQVIKRLKDEGRYNG